MKLDLHPGNVLLQIPDLDSWSEEQILTYYGQPVREEINRMDGLPRELSSELPQYAVVAAKGTKPLESDDPS